MVCIRSLFFIFVSHFLVFTLLHFPKTLSQWDLLTKTFGHLYANCATQTNHDLILQPLMKLLDVNNKQCH